MWDKVTQGIFYIGMPIVAAYHFVCGNIFLNTAAQDAEGLEKAGNLVLAPVQFLLAGKVAVPEGEDYQLVQRFDYQNYLATKSAAAVLSLPISLPIGSLLKGIGYLAPSTRQRHSRIISAVESPMIRPNLDYYKSIGLAIDPSADFIETPQHKRRPGEENVLSLEKDLLKDVVRLLKTNNIPFWVDAGTCLGAYRYGGAIPWDADVDVAVLLPDFDNVMHVLTQLDKTKYCAQDWSNRCRPKTYIRIYIHENRNYVDVYCFAIDPHNKTVTYILSNDVSDFMADSWKIRESRFKIPTSFDTIFPLKKAYFDGIEVYVPNQTKKYLQDRYGENIGPARVYNEKTGNYEKDLTHPYWKLPHVYQ